MPRSYPFEELDKADLVVDAEYVGGSAKNVSDDPLDRLLSCGNQGGFRVVGSSAQPGGYKLAVIYSSGEDPDWPDGFDPATGTFTYFGDNKRPGYGLHDTRRRGNEFLRNVFAWLHSGTDDRHLIPPAFVFWKGKKGRDVIFRGLAAPGAHAVSSNDDLTAIWRTRDAERFQNYRAIFTILDAQLIPRGWINALLEGGRPLEAAPDVWRSFQEKGIYKPLLAPRVRGYRTEEEQQPRTREAKSVVQAIWSHFAPDPYAFEDFAARLWLMQAGAVSYRLTRHSVDGGRDAIGELLIGPPSDPIALEFALEAKCYKPGANTVGVRESARLISRLRHRQFGVLVTTSVVARQAYQEIRDDAHPVVIISSADMAQILSDHGHSTPEDVVAWLQREFPVKS
jgi:hypothetical protein